MHLLAQRASKDGEVIKNTGHRVDPGRVGSCHVDHDRGSEVRAVRQVDTHDSISRFSDAGDGRAEAKPRTPSPSGGHQVVRCELRVINESTVRGPVAGQLAIRFAEELLGVNAFGRKVASRVNLWEPFPEGCRVPLLIGDTGAVEQRQHLSAILAR